MKRRKKRKKTDMFQNVPSMRGLKISGGILPREGGTRPIVFGSPARRLRGMLNRKARDAKNKGRNKI